MLSALISLTLLSAPALADDAEKTVAYRKAVYSSIGAHMKASSMIIKGEVAREAELAGHAASFVAMSKLVSGLFPEGTGPAAVPSTHALPSVWEKPDLFKQKAADFEKAAEAFEAAAKGTDQAAKRAAFMELGKTCGGCHDDFKADEK